jgi:hypothetical protein
MKALLAAGCFATAAEALAARAMISWSSLAIWIAATL